MIKVELVVEGDLLYLDGKLITFEQGVHGDYWLLEGVYQHYSTLEDLIEGYCK